MSYVRSGARVTNADDRGVKACGTSTKSEEVRSAWWLCVEIVTLGAKKVGRTSLPAQVYRLGVPHYLA